MPPVAGAETAQQQHQDAVGGKRRSGSGQSPPGPAEPRGQNPRTPAGAAGGSTSSRPKKFLKPGRVQQFWARIVGDSKGKSSLLGSSGARQPSSRGQDQPAAASGEGRDYPRNLADLSAYLRQPTKCGGTKTPFFWALPPSSARGIRGSSQVLTRGPSARQAHCERRARGLRGRVRGRATGPPHTSTGAPGAPRPRVPGPSSRRTLETASDGPPSDVAAWESLCDAGGLVLSPAGPRSLKYWRSFLDTEYCPGSTCADEDHLQPLARRADSAHGDVPASPPGGAQRRCDYFRPPRINFSRAPLSCGTAAEDLVVICLQRTQVNPPSCSYTGERGEGCSLQLLHAVAPEGRPRRDCPRGASLSVARCSIPHLTCPARFQGTISPAREKETLTPATPLPSPRSTSAPPSPPTSTRPRWTSTPPPPRRGSGAT